MTQRYPRIKNNSPPSEPAGTVRNRKSKRRASLSFSAVTYDGT
jgi:hypothetical protein